MKKEINSYTRSDLAECIAFHDFKTKDIQINNLFEYLISLFHEYDLEPTRMGVTSPTNQSKSMKTYTREHKKIQTIPENEIQSITLHATSNQSNDYLFSLIFDKSDIGFLTFIADSHIFKRDNKKINDLYKNIIKFLSPSYGYFLEYEFKKGPEYYPYGIPCSSTRDFSLNNPERKKIIKWGHKCIDGTYKTGDLRDVYPMNLLVNAHLTREVFPNTSFEQFIDSDKRHGTLEKIADNHYAWHVEEANIPFVREALRPSGMIIAG